MAADEAADRPPPSGGGLLAGKRILVTGVATKESIAFNVAREAQLAGAEVVLSSFGRMRRLTERAAKRLPEPVDVLELDVTSADDLKRAAEEIGARWGRLDGALHAVAFAPEDALDGRFLETPPASAGLAFEVTAFSFKSLAAALLPLLSRDDDSTSSLVTLSFETSVAWPGYDWMGVAKAALESILKYVSYEVGPHGVRANAISAGPLATISAKQVPYYHRLVDAWHARAPIGWDDRDTSPVADAACFLLSERARGITGEIIHVDGGARAAAGYPDRLDALAEQPAEAGDADG